MSLPSFFDLSPLFVEPFGRDLQFCHLEFDNAAIFGGCMSENAQFQWKGEGVEY